MTALLQVEHLSKQLTTERGAPIRQALHDINFDLNAGETIALIGEAGAGKSTLIRALALLARPTQGKVIFEGKDLARQSEGALRPVRRRLQVLFGDPRTALNPASLVSEVMIEPLRVQRIGAPEQQQATVKNALRQVGLNSLLLDRRLTALSAGERQRVALARLLTLEPALIICDDPARTLPPLAADQLFKLMDDVRHKHGTAFLWLVNNLKAVGTHADRVGVLYQGRLVELGKAADVLGSPQHPYARQVIGGPSTASSSASSPPHSKGCPYHPHCPHVMEVCRHRMPSMVATPTGQTAACFLFGGTDANAHS